MSEVTNNPPPRGEGGAARASGRSRVGGSGRQQANSGKPPPPTPPLKGEGSSIRPYLAVFAGRLQVMLQYRTAAIAGFITQLWFGIIRILIFAAFYAGGAVHAPMSLGNVVTYTWLGQAFLVFLPWAADPDVAEMVRTGAVAYERLRPVDTYAWWYMRALAYSVARALPRAALMFAFAAALLPMIGLGKWSLAPPPSLAAAGLFVASGVGMVLLSASIVLAINIIIVRTLDDRGPNLLVASFVNLLSGAI